MPVFTPYLASLPAAQQRLWPELAAIPEAFTLYGGTALALRLGHRVSVDFDFFSNLPFDPDRLARSLPFLRDAERVQVEANTLTCRVDRGRSVLVSFFGGLTMGRVVPPDRVEGPGFQVASLLDVAATKMAVIQKRAEVKDYVDIDAVLQNGIDLASALAAARGIHGPSFNPLITLKALCYFGDVPELGELMRARLASAVAEVDAAHLPNLAIDTPYSAKKAELS